MTNLEFSNEFDVLYNNITSNQAPGLDEYEKSVFLTKAQDEIVKAYFNPKTNKVQEGFDGNEKRQIDFSMLMQSKTFKNKVYVLDTTSLPSSPGGMGSNVPQVTTKDIERMVSSMKKDVIYGQGLEDLDGSVPKLVKWVDNESGEVNATIVSPFLSPFFDDRDNTNAVELAKDILMFVNEYVIVSRGKDNDKVRLTVIPINYNEYSRLMSKPLKRPLKFNSWRLLDNSNSKNRAELVIGPNDIINQYTIRYVKRPDPIVLIDLEDGLTLGDNISEETPCKLDPILHPEILQRAVELAKAAYTGDLTSQVALGQTSQTNMGIVTQNR